ncbi:MAG: N-acetyltransferase family protein [Ktedonobacterales bacterium]
MGIYLAPVNPETDYPRIAELMNTASKACVTLAQLREDGDNAQPGRIHLRIAAVDANGRMLGYGDVGRDPGMPAGRFWFDVVVDCDARGRGVGSMLYDDIVQFAREQGATSLEIAVRDSATAGLRFAARRGFTVERHDVPSAADNASAHAVDRSGTDRDQSGVYIFVRELA